jgi:hypothetical protein
VASCFGGVGAALGAAGGCALMVSGSVMVCQIGQRGSRLAKGTWKTGIT